VRQVRDRFLKGKYECHGLALGLSRIESAREGLDCQADVPLIEHLTRVLPAGGYSNTGRNRNRPLSGREKNGTRVTRTNPLALMRDCRAADLKVDASPGGFAKTDIAAQPR